MAMFDVMGPIMIEPSSSQTTGVAKICYLARRGFLRSVLEVEGS
jgi:L-serine deaminase